MDFLIVVLGNLIKLLLPLVIIIKCILFFKTKSKKSKPVHFFYFDYTNISCTDSIYRKRYKKAQNLLSATLIVLIVVAAIFMQLKLL